MLGNPIARKSNFIARELQCCSSHALFLFKAVGTNSCEAMRRRFHYGGKATRQVVIRRTTLIGVAQHLCASQLLDCSTVYLFLKKH